MSIMDEETNLYKYFKEENLVKEKVYKSKKKYIPLYINEELYEKTFNEKYTKKSYKRIIEMFSITLDKSRGKEEIGYAYSDKQEDPMGISLSGNEGSGRAFFYGECFNIKGDKTSLATSPKEVYSNGKYALGAAIKETVISNIISKELSTPSFETLAILDTTDTFEFIDEHLSTDDTIVQEKYTLPSVIEIRISKDKRLYRISNAFKNKDTLTYKQLIELSDKLALLEAEKYIKRFLHGSWSVGNISVDANLIDFDTASFVKGRSPQYSNTNKYKSNYFGFEILGSKMILKMLFENSLVDKNHKFEDLEKDLDYKYNNYLKIEFCKIIGLNYENDYLKHKNILDELFEKFIYLSKEFIPNYYDLNVLSPFSHNTYIYDFSRFFQKYLIERNGNNDILCGVNLLLNNTIVASYKKIGFVKEKVDDFFKEYITLSSDNSKILSNAIDFVKLYIKLFEEIDNTNDIKFKQYILNMNRNYLYASDEIYSKLSYLYQEKRIDSYTLNIIIKYLINTNIRIYDDIKEYLCNLNIKDNYLSYMVISKEYYYYVIVPYHNFEITFAKLYLYNDEYMFHHKNNTLISEKVYYDKLSNIVNTIISINGLECNIETANCNESTIKESLKNYYNIDAQDIYKIEGGFNDCYCVKTTDKKYFLKILDKYTPIEQVVKEDKILHILKKNNINVPNIIKTNTNKLTLSYNNNLLILEDYLEGEVYHNKPLQPTTLLDSAELLGKIHNILKREVPSNKFNNIWNNFNIKEYEKEINNDLYEIEKLQDDSNYKFIKEILNYKKENIGLINKYFKMFKKLTYCMSQCDYSKRNIICNNNEIVGVIDFSSCEIAPVSWELIRSFFLSTQEYDHDISFDYELFFKYIDKYLKEFNLNEYDIELMPYLLMYQLLLNDNEIKRYIYEDIEADDINFLKLKYDICRFLKNEAINISKKLTDRYCKK